MNQEQISAALVSRFSSLGQIDSASFADRALATIREWLVDAVDLPSKEVFLKATSDALDDAFAGFDTPGPDMIVEPALKALILGLVGYAYDYVANQKTPVV